MSDTTIPYSTLQWLEGVLWRYKNFSKSEEARKLANVVFDTIKADSLTITPIRYCTLEELITYSDGAIRYRIYQIEKRLEKEENQYDAKTLIDEKYSIEKALKRK